MNHSKFKGLMLCSLAALFVAGQAFAHTGVRDQATAGTSSYNGFTITHGCGGDSGDPYPVLGQAALFPYGGNVVWRDATGAVIDGSGILADNASLNLAVTGYAGFSSPFATSQEIVDSLGNVQGLFWKDGAMEPKLNAVTPFKVSAPKLDNTSATNCVKTLKVRIGVINYCDVNKNAANDAAGPYNEPHDAFGRKIPKLADLAGTGGIQRSVAGAPYFQSLRSGNGDNNRQDWWFGGIEGGSALYNDPDLLQPIEEIVLDPATGNPVLDPATGKPTTQPVTPYWTTLTVNNPACGSTRVVSVEPTGAAFDAYLTGPNTQPFTKGASNF